MSTAPSKPPAISIVIPVYNGAAFLKDAIESALNQSVAPAEIVIVDDASTDATPQVISQYASHPCIQTHRLPERLLAPAAWNSAIRLSHGSHFVVLAHDDMLDRGFIVAAQEQLRNAPDANLIVFSYRTIDTAGQPQGDVRVDKNFTAPGSIDAAAYLDRFCRFGQFFIPTSVLTSRTCFDQLNGFDEQIRVAYDWDFYLHHGMLGQNAILSDQIMASYRYHESQSIVAHTSTDNGDSDLIFRKLGEFQKRLSPRQMDWLVANMCAFLMRTATGNLANPQVPPERLIQQRGKIRTKLLHWRHSGMPGANHVCVRPPLGKQRLAWNIIRNSWSIRLFRAAWSLRNRN